MTPLELGTFTWYHKPENFTRTWHLWGTSDELGELVCIHLGISKDLACASRELTRNECKNNELRKHAFALAEQRLAEAWASAKGGDCEVIELNDYRRH